MSEFLNSESSWLNLTNALLGVAVLVCLFAVGRVVLQDIRARMALRARTAVKHDDHAFHLESLGITMADGGQPINESAFPLNNKPVESDDPPNIIRSDN